MNICSEAIIMLQEYSIQPDVWILEYHVITESGLCCAHDNNNAAFNVRPELISGHLSRATVDHASSVEYPHSITKVLLGRYVSGSYS